MERLVVGSEAEISLPVLLCRPKGAGRAPLVIILHHGGKQAIIKDHLRQVSALVDRGFAVLLPDLRSTGELAISNWMQEFWNGPARGSWDHIALLLGRPVVGMALTDLRACLQALSDRSDLSTNNVKLIGLGNAGSTSLFLAALEPRVEAVVIENIGKTYAEEGSAVGWASCREDNMQPPLTYNILRVADLPQIAAAVAPRRLVIGAAAGRFSFTREAYEVCGAGSNLSTPDGPLERSSITDIASGAGR